MFRQTLTKLLARALLNSAQKAPEAFEARAVLGIDEVGRGPLAGPVMAACVFVPEGKRHLSFWDEITDSKKLSAKKRDYLYSLIIEHSLHGIGECSVEEIDALNIHHATLKAMTRAFENCFPALNKNADEIITLIDGKFCPALPCPAQALVKGDSKSLEIAAASIIAKVQRDRLMSLLHAKYPDYGWNKNAGYGTAQHRQAIEKFGITEHHRRSFAPCSAFTV